MELDTPHHYEDVVTIGVANADGEKRIEVALDETVLHLELNDAQAKWVAAELTNDD